MDEFTTPTTYSEASRMVAPLNPNSDKFSQEQKELAFERLLEFFSMLLPDK